MQIGSTALDFPKCVDKFGAPKMKLWGSEPSAFFSARSLDLRPIIFKHTSMVGKYIEDLKILFSNMCDFYEKRCLFAQFACLTFWVTIWAMIPWLYIQTYCQPCYHPRLNATWQDEFASAGRWIIAHKVGSPTTSDNRCKCVDNSIFVQCLVQYPVDIHTHKFTVRTTQASGSDVRLRNVFCFQKLIVSFDVASLQLLM